MKQQIQLLNLVIELLNFGYWIIEFWLLNYSIIEILDEHPHYKLESCAWCFKNVLSGN